MVKLMCATGDRNSCLRVLETLESEMTMLDASSAVREMWHDWADHLRGHPLPFQVPWPTSLPGASGE